MKILILGGTGAMGIHLIDLLADDGATVYVTSRQSRADNGSIHFIKGNTHDRKFLGELLQNNRFDAIVDFMLYTPKEFQARMDALLAATRQYVFLSSARVYADSKVSIREASSRLLDVCEDQVYLATDEYALAKARQEDMLKACGKTNWTVIRPYITYGEGRLQLGVYEKESWLYRALCGRSIVFSRDIAARMTTLSYAYDVARCIKELVGKDAALGEIYQVTTAGPITWAEVLKLYTQIIGEKTGKSPKVFWADSLYDLGTDRPYYQAEYDRLYNRIFDSAKIVHATNLNDFTTVREGLEKSLCSFLIQPSFGEINWKQEALSDKEAGERTRLSEIPTVKGKAKYLFYRYLPRRMAGMIEDALRRLKRFL